MDTVGKVKLKKDQVNSFIVNSGVINGQVMTVDDSGSKGGFVSIKKVDDIGKKKN